MALPPGSLQSLLASRGLPDLSSLQGLTARPIAQYQPAPPPAPAPQSGTRPANADPVNPVDGGQFSIPPGALPPPSPLGGLAQLQPSQIPPRASLPTSPLGSLSSQPINTTAVPRSFSAPANRFQGISPSDIGRVAQQFAPGPATSLYQPPLPPGGLQLPPTNTRAPQPIPNYSAFAQNMQLPRFSQPQAPRVGFGAPSRLPGFAIR